MPSKDPQSLFAPGTTSFDSFPVSVRTPCRPGTPEKTASSGRFRSNARKHTHKIDGPKRGSGSLCVAHTKQVRQGSNWLCSDMPNSSAGQCSGRCPHGLQHRCIHCRGATGKGKTERRRVPIPRCEECRPANPKALCACHGLAIRVLKHFEAGAS